MATKKLVERSYRTIVGTLGRDTRLGEGTYIYDTNDSTRDYGLFAVFTGMTPDAERFSVEFLAEKTTPYMDSTRTTELTKPVNFLKEIIFELIAKLESGGLIEPNTAYHAFTIVLVVGDTFYIARVNGCPVFYMKDRKFRPLFQAPKARGRDSLQTATSKIDEGDRLVLCSEAMIKHPSKLELRNVLLAGDDLALACSKIHMLASRYEEVDSPRLMLIHFRRNEEKTQTLFTRRNAIVVCAVALFFMILFLWGDIVRLVDSSDIGYIVNKKNLFQRAVESVSKDTKKYTPELVYDKLAVAYDAAVDNNGVLYIIDDRENKIIRFDQKTGESSMIGGDADLTFPTGIEVTPDRIYVSDFSSVVSRLYAFDMNGALIGKIPNNRSSNIALRNPKSLAIYDNNLFVCDRGNNRIVIFGQNGSDNKVIDIPKSYREPNGISITESGIMFVTLKLSGSVVKIEGKSISRFTIFEDESGKTQKVALSKPSGIAVDKEGFVYIADTANRRILITNPMGKITGIIDQDTIKDFESFYPMSVKLDPARQNLYIVAANRYSYGPDCEHECQSKIWKIKI